MPPQPDINKIVETLSQQIASVAGDVNALTSAGQNRDAELKAITAKLDALHDALMTPQAGQQGSLLERVARITILVESVSRTGKIVSTIIVLLGLLGISVKLGIGSAGGK
jgi:hypothetical protein